MNEEKNLLFISLGSTDVEIKDISIIKERMCRRKGIELKDGYLIYDDHLRKPNSEEQCTNSKNGL